jgi:hypothetical protein
MLSRRPAQRTSPSKHRVLPPRSACPQANASHRLQAGTRPPGGACKQREAVLAVRHRRYRRLHGQAEPRRAGAVAGQRWPAHAAAGAPPTACPRTLPGRAVCIVLAVLGATANRGARRSGRPASGRAAANFGWTALACRFVRQRLGTAQALLRCLPMLAEGCGAGGGTSWCPAAVEWAPARQAACKAGAWRR